MTYLLVGIFDWIVDFFPQIVVIFLICLVVGGFILSIDIDDTKLPPNAQNVRKLDRSFYEFDLDINGGKHHFLMYRSGHSTAITEVSNK